MFCVWKEAEEVNAFQYLDQKRMEWEMSNVDMRESAQLEGQFVPGVLYGDTESSVAFRRLKSIGEDWAVACFQGVPQCI
jgi:hypothetical protein